MNALLCEATFSLILGKTTLNIWFMFMLAYYGANYKLSVTQLAVDVEIWGVDIFLDNEIINDIWLHNAAAKHLEDRQ